MPNVVFFSYSETDRDQVVVVKGRAVNSRYANLDFRVQDLLRRWNTADPAVVRRAISTSITGTSRTIVFVGRDTYMSFWVPIEVNMTLEAKKPVYAIRVSNTLGPMPECLSSNRIQLHEWSESNLQALATW